MSINHQRVEFITTSTARITKAVNDEVDWWFACLREQDLDKRKIYLVIFENKFRATCKLAKEVYEQL